MQPTLSGLSPGRYHLTIIRRNEVHTRALIVRAISSGLPTINTRSRVKCRLADVTIPFGGLACVRYSWALRVQSPQHCYAITSVEGEILDPRLQLRMGLCQRLRMKRLLSSFCQLQVRLRFP